MTKNKSKRKVTNMKIIHSRIWGKIKKRKKTKKNRNRKKTPYFVTFQL